LVKIFSLFAQCSFSGIINWSEPILSAASCVEGDIKYLPDLWGAREKVNTPTRMSGYIGNIHIAKIKAPELFQKEYNKIQNIFDSVYYKGFSEQVINYYQKNKYKEKLPFNRPTRYLCSKHIPKNTNIKSYTVIDDEELELVCGLLDNAVDIQ
jgi:hypothetical protein